MKFSAREIVLVSFFAALSVIAAMFSKYGGEAVVPFSLMPLVVMFAGALLGPRLGALSMGVYLLLGLVGIPVFATAPFGGPAYLLKPTAGFLFGFILAAFLIGLILNWLNREKISSYFIAMLVGIIAIYLIGLPYFYLVFNYYLDTAISMERVIQVAFLPFIIFDLIKGLIAAILGQKIYHRLKSNNLLPSQN